MEIPLRPVLGADVLHIQPCVIRANLLLDPIPFTAHHHVNFHDSCIPQGTQHSFQQCKPSHRM
jgi:hypothetical protein